MKGLWYLAVALLLVQPARAHEVRPAYLEILQTDEATFQARLSQPSVQLGDGRLGGLNLVVRFPGTCKESAPLRHKVENDYLEVVSTFECPSGLRNEPIRVDGLEKSLTDVFVSFVSIRGRETNQLLTPQNAEFVPFGAASGSLITSYLGIGVRHLLGGLDHVLFILGLCLLVPRVRQLLLVASAFTVSHSATLALTVLGWITPSPAAVEAAIALSVLFVAFDANRRTKEGAPIYMQHPHYIALAFGLLHGMGFASMLADADMPHNQLLLVLLWFNIGVEIGQVLVIAGVLMAGFALSQLGHAWKRAGRDFAGFSLGAGAVYFMWSALASLIA